MTIKTIFHELVELHGATLMGADDQGGLIVQTERGDPQSLDSFRRMAYQFDDQDPWDQEDIPALVKRWSQ